MVDLAFPIQTMPPPAAPKRPQASAVAVYECPETRQYYDISQNERRMRHDKGKALRVLGEDDGGGAEAAQRTEGQARGQLGRAGRRRRLRPLRAGQGRHGAAQGREAGQARQETHGQEVPGEGRNQSRGIHRGWERRR